MLRLWRDLYRIVLHPDQVSLVRIRQGRFSKTEAKSAIIETQTVASPPWKGAVDRLGQLISGIQSDRADVEVVLSNHFVRYVVLPWSNEVVDIDEALVMARIRFEEVYGDMASGWEIRLSEAGYGESCVACAIDRELLQEVAGAFLKTSLHLISIQPYLMSAFNQCREKIKDANYLLMLAEHGRLGLVQVRNRQWSQIRVAVIGNLVDELPGLLKREELLNGQAETGKQYLFTLEHLQDNSPLNDLRMLSFSSADAQTGMTLRSA